VNRGSLCRTRDPHPRARNSSPSSLLWARGLGLAASMTSPSTTPRHLGGLRSTRRGPRPAARPASAPMSAPCEDQDEHQHPQSRQPRRPSAIRRGAPQATGLDPETVRQRSPLRQRPCAPAATKAPGRGDIRRYLVALQRRSRLTGACSTARPGTPAPSQPGGPASSTRQRARAVTLAPVLDAGASEGRRWSGAPTPLRGADLANSRANLAARDDLRQ